MTHHRTQQTFEPGRLAALATLALLTLAGCTVGPKYHQPPALAQAPPPAYKEITPPSPTPEAKLKCAAAPLTMASTNGSRLILPTPCSVANGGKSTMSPELNALEDELNIDNQTIKEYFQNFRGSPHCSEARAEYYPTIGNGSGVDALRTSSNLGTQRGWGQRPDQRSGQAPHDITDRRNLGARSFGRNSEHGASSAISGTGEFFKPIRK